MSQNRLTFSYCVIPKHCSIASQSHCLWCAPIEKLWPQIMVSSSSSGERESSRCSTLKRCAVSFEDPQNFFHKGIFIFVVDAMYPCLSSARLSLLIVLKDTWGIVLCGIKADRSIVALQATFSERQPKGLFIRCYSCIAAAIPLLPPNMPKNHVTETLDC